MDICAGNPMYSSGITQMKRGHHKANQQQHNTPLAAKPWTRGDVGAAVNQLEEALKGSAGMQALTIYRDAVILCLLWETHSRGDNAGKWRMANLRDAAGEA
jgi:hypothetical protein